MMKFTNKSFDKTFSGDLELHAQVDKADFDWYFAGWANKPTFEKQEERGLKGVRALWVEAKITREVWDANDKDLNHAALSAAWEKKVDRIAGRMARFRVKKEMTTPKEINDSELLDLLDGLARQICQTGEIPTDLVNGRIADLLAAKDADAERARIERERELATPTPWSGYNFRD